MYMFDDHVIAKIINKRYSNPLAKYDVDDLSLEGWIELLAPYVNETVELRNMTKQELKNLGIHLDEYMLDLIHQKRNQLEIDWKPVMAYQIDLVKQLFADQGVPIALSQDGKVLYFNQKIVDGIDIEDNEYFYDSGRPLCYSIRLDIDDHSEYVIHYKPFVLPNDIQLYFQKRKQEIIKEYDGDLDENDVLELLDEMQEWVNAFHGIDLKTAAYANSLGLSW